MKCLEKTTKHRTRRKGGRTRAKHRDKRSSEDAARNTVQQKGGRLVEGDPTARMHP